VKRSTYSLAIGWFLCLGAVGYFIWESQTSGSQFDDAFIAYRYADNLVHGQGWVYNPGEYNEGTSGFLWTLLIAGGISIGLEAETVGGILGSVFSVAILVATFLFAHYQLRREWAWLSGFAPWIVLSTVAFPVWASSGMDLPLFTLCITIALMAAVRHRVGTATGASVAATLTRPEGIIVAFVVFISTVRFLRTARTRWMVSLVGYGLSIALLVGFRLAYFGSLLPVGDMSLVRPDPFTRFHFTYMNGSTSITRFITSGTVLLAAPLLVSVVRNPFYRPAVLYCAAAAIYSISFETNGWSHTPLLSYALPAFSAVAIHGCEQCWKWDETVGLAAIGAVATTLCLHVLGGTGYAVAYAFSACILALILFLAGKKRGFRLSLTALGFGVCALFVVIPLQKSVQEKWPVLLTWTRSWYLSGIREINTRTIDDMKSFIETLTKNGERPLVASDRIGRLGFITGCPIIDLFGRIGTPDQDRRSHSLIRSDKKERAASIVKNVLQREPKYIFYNRDSRINFPMVDRFNKDKVFQRYYTWNSRIEGFQRLDKPRIDQRALTIRLKAAPRQKMPEARPNVVLISIDTLRADHLESHGYVRKTAPTLTKLATLGIRFERAISQASWTLPSMASILSSEYPFQHRAVTSTGLMHNRLITIAEALQAEGYYTIGVVSNEFISRKRGFAQGFDVFDENVIPEQDEITSSMITRIATELVADLKREPFFLWTHYMDPHFAYIRHPEIGLASNYRGEFGDRIEILQLVEHQQRMKQQGMPALDPEDLAYVHAVYDEEIAFTDASIGRLLKTIDTLGFSHPTVFIVVADHGEFFSEHDQFGHPDYLYEELIHVPLIISGDIDPSLLGQVVDQTVETRNIPLTIMNLVRGTKYKFKGVDLLEVARGNVAQSEAFSETNCTWDADCGKKTAITYENWKLIANWKKKTSYELYWLTFDKKESNNIWKQESVKIIRIPLEAKLATFIKHVKAVKRSRASEFKLSSRQEKRLRGLGYIQ
jgi:arylsulfatase A-like enzyme